MRGDPIAQPRRADINSIQYLRGIAALLVVAFHVKVRLARMGYDGAWPGWLGCGVDIFFVISGTIMWITTFDRPMSPGAFLLRRFLRIAPLYYAMTALIVAIMLVAPALVVGGRIDLHHIAASVLFLPALHPVLGTMEPVLPQGWTLNYEMGFYLLFAGALFLSWPFRALAVLLALLGLVLAGLGSDPRSIFGFFTSSLILEFGFGLLVGVAVTSGLRPPKTLAAMLLLAGAVGIPATWTLVESGVSRAWLSGTSAMALVSGAVFLEVRGTVWRSRVMHLLGDASYSIYLVHGLVLSAIGAAWAKGGLGIAPVALAAFTVVSVVGAALVGIAVYYGAERPLQNLSRRVTSRKRAVAATSYSRL